MIFHFYKNGLTTDWLILVRHSRLSMRAALKYHCGIIDLFHFSKNVSLCTISPAGTRETESPWIKSKEAERKDKRGQKRIYTMAGRRRRKWGETERLICLSSDRDIFVRFFSSFSHLRLSYSLSPFASFRSRTSIKPGHTMVVKKKKKKRRRRTRNKKWKKREFILWVESRRRPESYVSRIWKAPGFLPGIIENRCRLSLYVDRRSLCTGWVKRRGGWEELSPRTTAFTTARIHPPLPFLLLLRHR